MNKIGYRCSECGKQESLVEGQPAPICCGKPMEPMGPLPFCRVMPDPEQARNNEEDEPCDDSSAPRRR